ncbi:unnamed protein product [Leptidea sinapis]|uniref:BEN domain-containing protein n=1 Tax=Leptidea sinapis TaxID=189913 RepID=A0A5E4PXV4_9NEOP|nr:unnamed protein product [Leptidea sinapis]
MSQRLWFLLEWVDESNVFSNYSVVSDNYLLRNDGEIRTGSIVLVRDRRSNLAKRGQILRLSDNKRYIKELKVMLERQDNQVKNVLALCMNTMKEMKTGAMNTSELNITQSSLKINSQPTRIESMVNNQLLRTLHEKTLHNQMQSIASSTPLPPKHPHDSNDKLTFDQCTQTDPSLFNPPIEKIEELEAVVHKLYKQFLDLVGNEPIETQSVSTEIASEHEQNLNDAKDDFIAENHNSSGGKIETDKNGKKVKVRRVSAQTTNTALQRSDNAADAMVSIGNGNAVVPARLLNKIDWRSYTSATRVLLQAVFPRRSCITTKCTDEAKLYRNRQKYKKVKHRNQENVPPSPASSTDCLTPNKE